MVVLYALVRIEQNSSKIVILAVNEHFLVGNAFTTAGEIGYMDRSIFLKVISSDITVSLKPIDLEGCVTTQNVRNCHIMGGSSKYYHAQKSMVFEIFAKNVF